MELRDDFTYVLTAHRDAKDAPTWIYAAPSMDDVLTARREASKPPKDGEAAEAMDMDEWACVLLAQALRSVDGLTVKGEPLRFPVGAPLAERRAFVGRLPYRWTAELTAAVQRESDVDDKEAVSPAEAGVGDADSVEALRLPNVPAQGSA